MPTIKILTCNSCSPSARLLRDKISDLAPHLRVLLTKNAKKIRRFGRFIRYGNADQTRGTDTSFNSASFIRLVANKLAFSKVMEAAGIYSPVYHADGMPEVYPVVIRKTLTASNAIGLIMCADKAAFDAKWQPGYYWTPFVKTAFELRAHVVGGQIVKLFKKVRADGAEEEAALPIRNLDHGYHYQARNLDAYAKVQELVDKVHPILNGSFYTLDLGWDKATKQYFVFEANSGSGLNSQTVEHYAHYLTSQLNAHI